MSVRARAEDLGALASDLRARHFGDTPLLLANVWDAGSARAVVEAGHPVVATSSAAVAASLGQADNEGMDAETAFTAISRIAASVQAPVTADIESGYGLPPAELVTRLLGAGAVGCNIEDTDHHGPGVLVDSSRQAQRVHDLCETAKAAGVDLVVNARVDVYLRDAVPTDMRATEAIRRGRLYAAAGATCVYPIGVTEPGDISLLVAEIGAPVNIWLRRDTPTVAELRELGVRRISVAAALYRATLAHTRQLARELLGEDGDGLWDA
ncbi:MAG TPA: isocitrate lyase/phosphoenolpyruvate mutase family protein [Acidimicrobiales bacterium]|nr:isocitrate lyase/phosphoenolpyruvate mutase family protein [Acidimicrobiales bacterium]